LITPDSLQPEVEKLVMIGIIRGEKENERTEPFGAVVCGRRRVRFLTWTPTNKYEVSVAFFSASRQIW
jgi:hypothetical protein